MYSQSKTVLIPVIILGIVLTVLISCDGPVRDVSGEYKKVKCKVELQPEYLRMRITKLDGNNFITDFWTTDLNHNRDKITYGLYGNEMKFHGVALMFFKDNFSKVYHKNTECSWEKKSGLEPLEEKLQ